MYSRLESDGILKQLSEAIPATLIGRENGFPARLVHHLATVVVEIEHWRGRGLDDVGQKPTNERGLQCCHQEAMIEKMLCRQKVGCGPTSTLSRQIQGHRPGERGAHHEPTLQKKRENQVVECCWTLHIAVKEAYGVL